MSQDVPISLDLALGSGSAQLELDELDLTALKADGSSGQVEIDLPDGDYDMVYDVGSGAVSMSFPEKGRHNFQVEGGSGKLEIFVPASMEMMVVIEDKGSGRLTLDESQFTQTDIGTDGQGIWVTDGYEDSSNRIDLLLDTGSGSVALLEE